MPGPRNPRGGYQKPKDMGKTIRRLLGYLTASPWPLVLVAVCLLASVAANLGGSYMMRGIINDFIWSGCTDFAGLGRAILLLVGVYLVGCLASYGRSAIMVQLAQRGVNRLRKDLFSALQKLPLSYFDAHTHGELMSRFTNDADNVQMALEQSVVSMFSSLLMFVGLVGLMLFINWRLFFVTALVLAATALLFKQIGSRSRKFYQAQQGSLGAVNGSIQETIEGLKVVKAFTHEAAAKEDFRKLNETYRDAAQKANFYSGIMGPVTGNLMNVSYALTAAFGGLLSIVQNFDLGGLVIYLRFSKQVGQPLEEVSMQMTTLLSALAGAERIFDVMDTRPEPDDGRVVLVPAHKDADGKLHERAAGSDKETLWAWKTPKTGMPCTLVKVTEQPDGSFAEGPDPSLWAWRYQKPDGSYRYSLIRGAVNDSGKAYILTELKGAVRFIHVDFSYVPGKQILHDVSVYANPGQKIAFVGSTGAGKTTITNLINRFYEIQDGSITFDGLDVRAIAKDSLRQALGAVLQDTHLFTGTVMDNIRYGRLDATDEECIAAAKTAGAHSFIRRLPDGYNTLVTGDGANLSQGQRQLLAIARAAVADPPVMILDEATSSIDTRTEAQIQKGMDALMEGRTVFVIAHRLSTVRNSDCIVVIEHGHIEEKGSHAQLLAEQGRYYQLYTGQFQLD